MVCSYQYPGWSLCFKELSERNLDIKTITPADGILHIEPQWSYIGQDKYACISEEWYSEEELLAHWGVVYFTGKGILALPMYFNSEPHKTNYELTKQYLKNNFSHKVIDALEILLLSFFVITLVYFIFVAFTEILLLLILLVLIMIYRKL